MAMLVTNNPSSITIRSRPSLFACPLRPPIARARLRAITAATRGGTTFWSGRVSKESVDAALDEAGVAMPELSDPYPCNEGRKEPVAVFLLEISPLFLVPDRSFSVLCSFTAREEMH